MHQHLNQMVKADVGDIEEIIEMVLIKMVITTSLKMENMVRIGKIDSYLSYKLILFGFPHGQYLRDGKCFFSPNIHEYDCGIIVTRIALAYC